MSVCSPACLFVHLPTQIVSLPPAARVQLRRTLVNPGPWAGAESGGLEIPDPAREQSLPALLTQCFVPHSRLALSTSQNSRQSGEFSLIFEESEQQAV